ncbi:Uncharacterised protein [[Clostridium] sordellii]|nr:Uncharacterised protein [[Clostridium] sordellii] [Paeniclostridium sordellii]
MRFKKEELKKAIDLIENEKFIISLQRIVENFYRYKKRNA